MGGAESIGICLLGLYYIDVWFSLKPEAVKAVVFMPLFSSGSQWGPVDVVKFQMLFFRKWVYLCMKCSLLTGNTKGFSSSLLGSQE